MALETEAKIQVADHGVLRSLLVQLGAQPQGQQLEVNIYFDTADERLRQADTALRLRCTDKKNVLTYKGPQTKNRYKQRLEVQTTVAEAQAMQAILQQLGFRQSLLFEKRRDSWLLNNCRVELDELPLLGNFVEVEGPSEQDIDQVLGQLELDKEDLINKPYPTMLREHLERTGKAAAEIRFADGFQSSPES